MRHWIKNILLSSAFVLSLTGIGRAACTGPYCWSDDGQAYVQGSLAVKNALSGTSATQVNVSTMQPITPSSAFLQVKSTGGVVTYGLTSAWPFISTATARDQQYITVYATTTADGLTVSTGTATALIGNDPFIVISGSKSAVTFMYSDALKAWMEVGKQ